MNETADEKPKKDIAKKVITPKHRYFVPSVMKEFEADSNDEAVSKAKKHNQEEKVGD